MTIILVPFNYFFATLYLHDIFGFCEPIESFYPKNRTNYLCNFLTKSFVSELNLYEYYCLSRDTSYNIQRKNLMVQHPGPINVVLKRIVPSIITNTPTSRYNEKKIPTIPTSKDSW